MNSCGFCWKEYTHSTQIQVILGSGSSSINSIGISILPHQQPSIAATPQRFGFPQNGQRDSGGEMDILQAGWNPGEDTFPFTLSKPCANLSP